MDTLIDGNETSKEEEEKTAFESTIIDLLFLPAMMASDEPPDTSHRVNCDEAVRSKKQARHRKERGDKTAGEITQKRGM